MSSSPVGYLIVVSRHMYILQATHSSARFCTENMRCRNCKCLIMWKKVRKIFNYPFDIQLDMKLDQVWAKGKFPCFTVGCQDLLELLLIGPFQKMEGKSSTKESKFDVFLPDLPIDNVRLIGHFLSLKFFDHQLIAIFP